MTTSKVIIERQPDDVTCGPTCLHGIYRYLGEDLVLADVINDVEMLDEGGTFAANLARHALSRGYKATIYSFNILVFDPTWFDLDRQKILEKLKMQMTVKEDAKVLYASAAYVSFLENGGDIKFNDLSKKMLYDLLGEGRPIIAGLSATYLYKKAREVATTNQCNDIEGVPSGHFVVLTGIDEKGCVTINDPYRPNPLSQSGFFTVEMEHLICAILLGVLTCDANLVVIRK